MSADFDAYDYRNGTKNHWRRFVWNRVKDNLEIPARDAVVLYLPGSQALDVVEAERRGFRKHNLIAVDTDARVVRALRAQRLNCLHMHLAQAMLAWPSEPRVSVVMADMQAGFTDDVRAVAEAWNMHPAFTHAVAVFNMLRGRERADSMTRILLDARDGAAYRQLMPFINEDQPYPADVQVHRGVWLAWYLFMKRAHDLAALDGTGATGSDYDDLGCFGVLFPPSYRSSNGRQIFDSVILSKPVRKDFFWSNAREAAQPQWRRAVAAALAVRTQRLNGTLLN